VGTRLAAARSVPATTSSSRSAPACAAGSCSACGHGASTWPPGGSRSWMCATTPAGSSRATRTGPRATPASGRCRWPSRSPPRWPGVWTAAAETSWCSAAQGAATASHVAPARGCRSALPPRLPAGGGAGRHAPGVPQARIRGGRGVVKPDATRRLTCGVVVVELRGFEPLTPCMPSMLGWFTTPDDTFRAHTITQVGGIVAGWIMRWGKATRGADSGKFLARPLAVAVRTNDARRTMCH
jgi:hypothetical protein